MAAVFNLYISFTLERYLKTYSKLYKPMKGRFYLVYG